MCKSTSAADNDWWRISYTVFTESNYLKFKIRSKKYCFYSILYISLTNLINLSNLWAGNRVANFSYPSKFRRFILLNLYLILYYLVYISKSYMIHTFKSLSNTLSFGSDKYSNERNKKIEILPFAIYYIKFIKQFERSLFDQCWSVVEKFIFMSLTLSVL